MDTKAAFAFAIIAACIGGLIALATGRLSIKNGQIVIGQPGSATAPANPAPSTTPVPGATSTLPDTGSGGWGTVNPGSPVLSGNPSAISAVLGGTTSTTTLASIYDPTSTLQLISQIAGDGVAANPYGVG